MKRNLRKITFTFVLLCLGSILFAKEAREEKIDVAKEKAALKITIPGLIETFTPQTTYKLKYPRTLKYYDEKTFSINGAGFLGVDGSLFASYRNLLGNKIKEDIATDYTFEIETSGIENLKPSTDTYTNYQYQNTYVQDYVYTFPCKLKIYKGSDMIREYILDDGTSLFQTTYYKDFHLENLSTQSIPKLGFESDSELQLSISKNSDWSKKFKYCIEYEQYLKNYGKAKNIILALFGTYNFKEAVQIMSVEIEKGKPDNYAEINTTAVDFLNTLLLVKSYEDLIANTEKLKTAANIFQKLATQENINKSVEVLCLRNATYALLLTSDVNKAFENLNTLLPIDRGMGVRLEQNIPPFIEAFGVRAILNNYSTGELVLSLDEVRVEQDCKKIAAAINKRDSIKFVKETEKIALDKKAEEKTAALYANNIQKALANVVFLDGHIESDYISINFYALDDDNNVARKCGKEFYCQDAQKVTQSRTINDVQKINFLDKAGKTVKVYEPIQIVRTLWETAEKAVGPITLGYSEKTIAEFVKSVGAYNIYLDRTNVKEEEYIVMATKNNAKKKGYRLKYVVENNKFGDWMKVEPTIVEAIKSGTIQNTLDGATRLANLLTEHNLPSAEL